MTGKQAAAGRAWLIVGSLVVATGTGTVHAQQGAIPAPRVATPSRDDLRPVEGAPPPTAPRLSVVGDIERSPCPLADPKFADVTVPVTSVTFHNLKGISPEDLRPAWAPYAGTRQPVAVLCEIRDAAATILRQRGYLAAVQVPTQRIENGEIRMEVLFARIVAVRARGETRGAEAMIARYLNHLTQDEIFDSRAAERYLLLARDLPGYNVQLTLKPAGGAPGELIGEVTVLRRPYAVDATVQNMSSRAVGRWGAQLRAQAFGLTGMGDATSLAFYSTSDLEEQQILQAAHEFRLGSEGLKISGQFTYAWTEPDINGATPLRARTAFGTIGASYPLIRSQARSLFAEGGLDIVDQRVNYTGAPLSRDRLRVGYLRLNGEAIDLKGRTPRWHVVGNVELRKGLAILDPQRCDIACFAAGRGPSRSDGDPAAALVRMSGVGELALGKRWSVAVAPRAQIAFNPVYAFEEFTAGNYTIGRGFDPGTLSGDSGVGTSVELRMAGFDLGKQAKVVLHPYAFADGARLWNLNGAGRAQGLLSLGGGLRANIGDRARVDAFLAVPTDMSPGVTQRSVRFLVTLTTRILPWSNRP